MAKKKKIIPRIICVMLCLGLLCSLAALGINLTVKNAAKDHILTAEEAAQLTDVDCILVLGCGVRDDGTPSAMLYDRLKRSMELFELDAAEKLLMTGDHGRTDYGQ